MLDTLDMVMKQKMTIGRLIALSPAPLIGWLTFQEWGDNGWSLEPMDVIYTLRLVGNWLSIVMIVFLTPYLKAKEGYWLAGVLSTLFLLLMFSWGISIVFDLNLKNRYFISSLVPWVIFLSLCIIYYFAIKRYKKTVTHGEGLK